MELQLLQYDKNFSKKPIVQLHVLEDYNLLYSLSDNVISINDISRHNFPLIHLASKTKGANAFAMDVQRTQSLTDQITLVVRVCVAVKRKLQFWYWKRDELLEFAPDIELNDIPKVLAWTGNFICVGYKTEYVLFDVSHSCNLIEPSSQLKLPYFRFPTRSARKLICSPRAHLELSIHA